VAAYNRPDSLTRILGSIANTICPEGFEPELIISIDNSGSDDCYKVADKFEWIHGKKTVIHHERNLGLKDHILRCGDLSSRYDFIILLEDDLYVSRYFLDYAIKVANYYRDDNRLAGYSLYSYAFNETALKHFVPVDDGTDVYFMQLPSSWGQIWSQRHWQEFRKWLGEDYSPEIMETYLVPENVVRWPDSSWKKLYIYYMVVNDLYFVYPRLSLTTNFMDAGTHHLSRDNYLQVALQSNSVDYKLIKLAESGSVYDPFCEFLPEKLVQLVRKYEGYNFEVDLYGTKPLRRLKKRYVLTSRKSCNPLYAYSLSLKPHELNMVEDISGSDVFFARTSTINNDRYQLPESVRNAYYYNIPGYMVKTAQDYANKKSSQLEGDGSGPAPKECLKILYMHVKKTSALDLARSGMRLFLKRLMRR
jgi:hypothetical protein